MPSARAGTRYADSTEVYHEKAPRLEPPTSAELAVYDGAAEMPPGMCAASRAASWGCCAEVHSTRANVCRAVRCVIAGRVKCDFFMIVNLK